MLIKLLQVLLMRRRVEAVGTKIKLAAEKYLNSLGQKNI
jgi:hypothetical protein